MKRTLILSAALLVGVSACGENNPDVGKDGLGPAPAESSAQPTTSPTVLGSDFAGADLTVFAAASLTESFRELGEAYESEYFGAEVTFSFQGSQSLVAAISQGAPADVIATANRKTMTSITDELEDPPAEIFARNQLAIITEPGNPLMITGLADLADPDVKVVLGGPTVPVGKASRETLKAAGVSVEPVSEEQNVKDVLSKVRLGEADAGIVYVTDVQAAGEDVFGIKIPGITNVYPIGVLEDTDADLAADAFVELVLSPEGQAILATYGFKPAPEMTTSPDSATSPDSTPAPDSTPSPDSTPAG